VRNHKGKILQILVGAFQFFGIFLQAGQRADLFDAQPQQTGHGLKQLQFFHLPFTRRD
jgi:hypothetical protein